MIHVFPLYCVASVAFPKFYRMYLVNHVRVNVRECLSVVCKNHEENIYVGFIQSLASEQ